MAKKDDTRYKIDTLIKIASITSDRILREECCMEAKNLIDAAIAYYESDEGKCDGHYGSALSALGEYYWRCEDYDNAITTYENALKFTRSRFGENEGCKVITRNMDIVRKEMKEKQQLKG